MEVLDFDSIYKATRNLYGSTGNLSIDPVVFFKLMLTGYLENITSNRKLVEHCAMHMDILYFVGYDIDEQLPWHSTISQTRQLHPEIATGKITLYFPAEDFADYNAVNTVKLPLNPEDEENYKANVLIQEYAGKSADNSGLPSSY